MSMERGARLGPYEVTGFLGSGGMAEVYRARDVRLGREVALKILPDALSNDAEALARFEREARTASALNHPHLVTIHDIGETTLHGRTLRFMAMELVRGRTLRERLLTDSRESLLLHLASIADGLARAHEAGVIHRDLKPENVMISEDGFAKVLDFGLARRVAPAIADAAAERLTAEGFTVGTVGYMAPEQVRGARDLDHRVDIFAFGCMLYEIIAKQNPFEGGSAFEAMHRILCDEPPPLADAAVDRIVRRCLAKDREERYTSMREVAADVRAAVAVPGTAAEARVMSARPRRPRLALALVAAVVVALAGGAFVATRPRPAAIDSIAVLPFSNAAGEDGAFLAEGIGDAVVRDLGSIQSLRVIASSSTARYRDGVDPRHAARELDVAAVLVGKLRGTGGTLVLDAELVRGTDGAAIWSKRYARNADDVPALERELAKDVSAHLRLKLAPRRSPTADAEAYRAFLRGRQELLRGTAPSLKKAIEHFNRAIELDPDFALAYALLAQTHGRQAVLGVVPPRDAIRQETAEALEALALDDTLPDAHWTLALVASFTGDQPEYERRIARVLELDPNFPPVHIERAKQLLLAKRYDEAKAAYEKALALDPLSPRVRSTWAVHLYLARRYSEALPILSSLIEQFPSDTNAHAYLGFILSYLGRHDEALVSISRAPATSNPNMELWKGILLARAGRTAEARAIADRADRVATGRFLPVYYRAQLRAVLGERDVALSLLEQGKRNGEWLTWLRYDPGFDALRDDPRFAVLLAAPYAAR